MSLALSTATEAQITGITVNGEDSNYKVYEGFDTSPTEAEAPEDETIFDDIGINADGSTIAVQVDLAMEVVNEIKVTVSEDVPGGATDERVAHSEQIYTINVSHASPVSATPSKNTPIAGAAVGLNLKATIAAGVGDTITIDMGSFGLPGSIDEDDVTINRKNPDVVTVSGDIISLVVPDLAIATQTVPDPAPTGVGTQGSPDVATIRFFQRAGITNPTKAGTYEISINDDAGNGIGDEDIDAWNVSEVVRSISIDPTSGSSKTEITVTGKGFTDGSVTVFVDDGEDGIYNQNTDKILGTSTIDGGSFTLSGVTVSKDSFINAVDKVTETAGTEYDAEFDVKPSITVSPASVSLAEKLTIKLVDWDDTPVAKVRYGGTNGVVETLSETMTTGEFKVDVPTADETRVGTLRVEVLDANDKSLASADVEIVALSLSVTPSSAVIREQITIQGSGFADSEGITNVEIGSADPITVSAEASSSGNIVFTITVPEGIADGTHTITVNGDDGHTGTAELVVPEAEITLDPATSRRGTTVSVTGTGFPANDLILVQYPNPDDDGALQTVGTGTTGSTGSFTSSFTVPSFAGIGAGAEVTATSSIIDEPAITATATHSLPGSELSVDPAQAASGSNVTITGENMAVFAAISLLKIGGVEVTPVPAPSTDANGSFTASVLVPQLELGNKQVSVSVGGRTTTTFIEIVEASAMVSTVPAEVFASLIEADRLERVWHQDAATQDWSFYDLDPDLAAFNTLSEVPAGKVVTIINSGDPIEFPATQPSTLFQGSNNVFLK